MEAPQGPSRSRDQVCVSHEAARVLSEKNRARGTSSAPVVEAEHLLLGCVYSTGQRQSIGVLHGYKSAAAIWSLESAIAMRSAFFSPAAFTNRSNRVALALAQTLKRHAAPLPDAEV